MSELIKFKKPEDNLNLPELEEVQFSSFFNIMFALVATFICCVFIVLAISHSNYLPPSSFVIVLVAICCALVIYSWYISLNDALGHSINKDGIKIKRVFANHCISWSDICQIKLHSNTLPRVTITLYTVNNKRYKIDEKFIGIASIWMHTYRTHGKPLFELPKESLIYWAEITGEVPDEYVWEMSKIINIITSGFYYLMTVCSFSVGVYREMNKSSEIAFPYFFLFLALLPVSLIILDQYYTARKIIVNNDFIEIFYSHRSVKLDWSEIKSIDYYTFIKTKNGTTYMLSIDKSWDEGQDILMMAIIKKAKAKHINYYITSRRFLVMIDREIKRQLSSNLGPFYE